MEGEPNFEKPKSHYVYFDVSGGDHREVFTCDANNDEDADRKFREGGHSFESGSFSRSSTQN
ncbi:MAG: hypothetical protein WC027_02135 [Candidatus Paceibacterota bacterium]